MTTIRQHPSERSVASLILRDATKVFDAHPELSEEHFLGTGEKWIASKGLAAHRNNERFDLVVASELHSLSGSPYPDIAAIAEIASSAATWAHLDHHVEEVLDAAKRRDLYRFAESIAETAFDHTRETSDIMLDAESGLFRLATSGHVTKGAENIFSASNINALLARIEKAQSGSPEAGISTGFMSLDRILGGGLHPGHMTVIGGRTSTGKSTLAANVLRHVAVDLATPCGLFSTEMLRDSIIARFASMVSQVDIFAMLRSRMTRGQAQSLQSGVQRMLQKTLYLCDARPITMDRIRSESRRMARQGAKVIAVDYLQQVRGKVGTERRFAIEEVTHGCQELAGELGVHFILASQINRSGSDEPQLHHLSESTTIENDADNVLLIWRKRETDESGHQRDRCIVKADKVRHGPTGKVEMVFDGAAYTFHEYGVGE